MAQPLPTQLPVPITTMPAPGGVQPYGTRGGNNTANSYGVYSLAGTGAYLLAPGEQIDCDTTASVAVVVLPDATTCAGQVCRIQDATGSASVANPIVLDSWAPAQTINGQAAATFNITTANGGVAVRSNGAAWTIAG